MFDRLFKSDTPKLLPMQMRDIDRVLAIIGQTDSDDADEAREHFQRSGLDGMDVYVVRGKVMGVTGHHIDPETEGTAWLSWTYLDRSARGQGHGSDMINTLLGRLAGQGVRKIFIDTSDYVEDGKKIYGDAHALYEKLGATVEMTVPDYFEAGEAKLVYGLDNPQYAATPSPELDHPTGLTILGLDGAPETDDAAMIRWEAGEAGVRGLDTAMQDARDGGGRFVAITLPGDLADVALSSLTTAGFSKVGQLSDYYMPGLHQLWFITYDI